MPQAAYQAGCGPQHSNPKIRPGVLRTLLSIQKDPITKRPLHEEVATYSTRVVPDETVRKIFDDVITLDRTWFLPKTYKNLMPHHSLFTLRAGMNPDDPKQVYEVFHLQDGQAVSILFEWILNAGMSDADFLFLCELYDEYGDTPSITKPDATYHPQSILLLAPLLLTRTPEYKSLPQSRQSVVDRFIARALHTGSILTAMREERIQDQPTFIALIAETERFLDEKMRHVLDGEQSVYSALLESLNDSLHKILKEDAWSSEYWNTEICQRLTSGLYDTLIGEETRKGLLHAASFPTNPWHPNWEALRFYYESVIGTPYRGQATIPGFSSYARVTTRHVLSQLPPLKTPLSSRFEPAAALIEAFQSALTQRDSIFEIHLDDMTIHARVSASGSFEIAFPDTDLGVITWINKHGIPGRSGRVCEKGRWYVLDSVMEIDTRRSTYRFDPREVSFSEPDNI